MITKLKQQDKINAHINELKKKSPTQLTADDFEQLNNQNDYMREVVVKQNKIIDELKQKLDAKFVPLEIFSEDKLQFVTAELSKINMPFVEENTTLYVPEYAKTQAAALAASYKQNQPLGIRERVKLDIDRLVYCSLNIEEFFELLKRRGYEVKIGKYTAIKPPFGERFVRLKTLGRAYLPKNLEIRIADRDKFTDAIKEKFESANSLEKPFQITMMNTIIAVKEFRLIPKKLDNSKIYIFKNDANINFLSQQLKTIGEFHFTSRRDMCTKAEELQAVDTDEAKQQLKRVREVIQTYDKIIGSDYIGELIKDQKQQQPKKPKIKHR